MGAWEVKKEKQNQNPCWVWEGNSLKGIKFFGEKVAHNKITFFSWSKKLLTNQLIIARQNGTIDYIFPNETFSV